jgi:protein tyrosine phosphatase
MPSDLRPPATRAAPPLPPVLCPLFPCSGPHKPMITHPLNRFGGNMGPYSDALLPLKSVEYINASPIDNLGAGSLPFVATMCPKKETFAHFWSMVWEQGSSIIINLTHERDRVGSGPSDKRERYWPPLDPISEKQSSKWPVRPLTLATESCEQVPSLLRFTIELHGPVPADGSARPTRTVYLYWYSRWVDFPSSSSIGARPFYANAWAVLHIALYVLDQLEAIGPGHWAICHCSAGVGRTGTFLALLHVLRLLPTLTSEAELDAAVTTTIEAMRERRLWMVRAAPTAAPLLPPLPGAAPTPPSPWPQPRRLSQLLHTHSQSAFFSHSLLPPTFASSAAALPARLAGQDGHRVRHPLCRPAPSPAQS